MELSSFDGRCAVMCGERCQTYWLQAKNDFWEVVKLSYKLTNWQPLELGCRSNISRPFEYFSQQLLQQKGFGKGCTDSAKLLRIIKFNKQRLVLSTIHSTLVVPNVQLKQSFFTAYSPLVQQNALMKRPSIMRGCQLSFPLSRLPWWIVVLYVAIFIQTRKPPRSARGWF